MMEGADSSILWMWTNGILGLVNWFVCIWIQDVRAMNMFNCTLVYILKKTEMKIDAEYEKFDIFNKQLRTMRVWPDTSA